MIVEVEDMINLFDGEEEENQDPLSRASGEGG